MLKVGGMWVSPVEVEATLVRHAAVLDDRPWPCGRVCLAGGILGRLDDMLVVRGDGPRHPRRDRRRHPAQRSLLRAEGPPPDAP